MKARIITGILLAAIAAPALAGTLSVSNFTFGPVQTVQIPNDLNFPAIQRGNSVQAGQFDATFDADAIKIWCAELDQFFSFGTPITYTLEDATGALGDKLDKIGSFIAMGGAPVDADNSAVLQLGIWKQLYNHEDFSYAGPVVASAKFLRNAESQDMLLFVPYDLPEPGPLALLGAGLLGLGFTRKFS